ncbi:MAG: DsbA family oxidoreductase [Roseateles depolymerans]|uniref:DsbA family oxidoreductase n=1 Tax=Roseateles depolymerans TaxID=76731 RepID=A0A2W5DGB2_9BURK|nr:MAG: DsbA family oxidoreductase [Roseateles depolymerans]
MQTPDIVITYDFICPWCWIGHAHLRQALAGSALPRTPTVSYRPYELNPTMPRTGMNRREYRSAKFGSWAHSQALDADVTLAGRRLGLAFHYERVERTPNTRLAHQLMLHAQAQGDAARSAALCEAIFSAYFSQGRDIGEPAVLLSLAADAGLALPAVRELLGGRQGEQQVVDAEVQAQRDGVRSVPSLRIGAALISGAQPAPVLAEALARLR